MRTFILGIIGAAVLVTGTPVLAPSPAAAQNLSIEVGPRGVEVNRGRDRQVEFERYCARNPRDRDCRQFRRAERREDRRYSRDRPSRASVARCAARYRSYDPRTHTYVVNRRGDRAVCRL